MKNKILIVISLTLCSYNVGAVEFKSALGVGLQYGGMVGWQGSIVSDIHKARLGIGVFGATLGYDARILDTISIGPQIFLNHEIHGLGISANYYFSSTSYRGWNVALDLFSANRTSMSSTPVNSLFISAGYTF